MKPVTNNKKSLAVLEKFVENPNIWLREGVIQYTVYSAQQLSAQILYSVHNTYENCNYYCNFH